jgi:cellulose synthase/poly-beta-1,6-N-acetylglucosamine synthase-like glycosyltransferase
MNADVNLLTKMQDAWYETSFSVSKAAESVFGGVTCVSGPLAGFRREAIYNYLPAWAEDTFLGRPFPFATDRQLTGYVLGGLERGEELKRRFADTPFVRRENHQPRRWAVGYVRSARVITEVPDTPRRMLRQQVRWKKSFIRNTFFTGSFYWRRGPAASALFYMHVLFVMSAPVMVVRHLVWAPVTGGLILTALYIGGILLKGGMWGIAYRARNPGDHRWIYRPLMSLVYSALTLRRAVWSRA